MSVRTFRRNAAREKWKREFTKEAITSLYWLFTDVIRTAQCISQWTFSRRIAQDCQRSTKNRWCSVFAIIAKKAIWTTFCKLLAPRFGAFSWKRFDNSFESFRDKCFCKSFLNDFSLALLIRDCLQGYLFTKSIHVMELHSKSMYSLIHHKQDTISTSLKNDSAYICIFQIIYVYTFRPLWFVPS